MVTGGVAAVYGSDAVTGVVNFVTDRNFNGLKANVETGVSDYGDDKTFNAGIAVGKPLGERGHIEASYEYRDDPGLMRRSMREWGRKVVSVQGLGTRASPYHFIENARNTTATFGGLISGATGAGAALNGLTFEQNGVLSLFIVGIPTGTATVQSGGSGAYHDSSIKAAWESHQAFGRFDYELTDTLHTYVQASYTQNELANYDQYYRLNNTVFDGQNPFLPAGTQFTGRFRLGKFLQEKDRINMHSKQDQYFVVAGVDGKVGEWSWDLAVTQGRNKSTSTNTSQIDNQKLFAALDATRDASGAIVCRVTITNPGLYPGCVPYNAFGPTSASPAALAYITTPSWFKVDNAMTDISGSVSGSPFNNWAGPVDVSLSGEWRRQSLAVDSNASPNDRTNCTGLILNCTATTARWLAPVLSRQDEVSMDVGEVAAEIQVPLLKDVPFFQDLSINGAGRFTHYNTSGDAWTWKVGLAWQVSDQFKLRGTRSRDIRAPTLYDLFQPQGVSIVTQLDLLTNVEVTVPEYSGGNPHVTPEIGNTYTAGFVYQPSWIPRLSLALDAYHIEVSNALTTQVGRTIGPQTLCYNSGGTSPFCALIIRPGPHTDRSPSNAITGFYSKNINIARIVTYGADFEANYTTTLFENPLSLRFLTTWQPHLVNYAPQTPVEEAAGIAFSGGGGGNGSFAVPRVRWSAFADYTVGPVRINVRERWRSKVSAASTAGAIYAEPKKFATAAYTDATITYSAGESRVGRSELYLSIQNVWNKKPVAAAGSIGNTRIGATGGFVLGDDPIGRYFTLGLRLRR